MKWKKLIMLGDSNTQFGFGVSGWLSSLSDNLQRKCDVINRGFSGYNTDMIKLMLPDLLAEFDPENTCGLVLMLGSNDSTESSTLIQHVPLERYEKNVSYILDYIINWGLDKQKLILISPPRIFDQKWHQISGNSKPSHFDHLVKDYAKSAIKIGKEKNVNYLDFYDLMKDYGDNYDELLFDGLHLSQKGGSLLAQNLLPILDKFIIKDLKFNYPYWRDIKEDKSNLIQ